MVFAPAYAGESNVFVVIRFVEHYTRELARHQSKTIYPPLRCQFRFMGNA
jgi:hypothetical protein